MSAFSVLRSDNALLSRLRRDDFFSRLLIVRVVAWALGKAIRTDADDIDGESADCVEEDKAFKVAKDDMEIVVADVGGEGEGDVVDENSVADVDDDDVEDEDDVDDVDAEDEDDVGDEDECKGVCDEKMLQRARRFGRGRHSVQSTPASLGLCWSDSPPGHM
jgi:hypothetical protein